MKLVYNNRAFEILRSMRSSVEPSTLPFVEIQRTVSQSQIEQEEEEEEKKSSNNYGYTIHIFGLTYTHARLYISIFLCVLYIIACMSCAMCVYY